MDGFRRFFLRGWGALVPTLLTVAIVIWAYRLVTSYVGVYITCGLLVLCSSLSDRPAPGTIDPQIDPLRYGAPLNEWNERGERLTMQYKIIQNYQVLHERARTSKDVDADRPAEKAKNAALWEVAFAKYEPHLRGFLIASILVYFVGFFLASFISWTSWRATEGLLCRIPLIRTIYPNVKQVTDFLLTEREVDFSGVVAIEYPRKGVWRLV